MQVGDSMP